jgi:amino acid transporter, AAT family
LLAIGSEFTNKLNTNHPFDYSFLRSDRIPSSPSIASLNFDNMATEHADAQKNPDVDYNITGLAGDGERGGRPLHTKADNLARKLSARQVQMIAIGGTIGTGLFLGTGKSLATGGPASMLIAYIIVGAIVFTTMLSLGEMAAFMPIAGSFCTVAG